MAPSYFCGTTEHAVDDITTRPTDALVDVQEHVFPTPGFEGMEKRIEVEFTCATFENSNLRSIPQASLQEMLDLAECTIVSHRTNGYFDAYVLSESSLFVYANRMVLKTCGTTKLLNSCGRMIQLAEGVGYVPCHVKYTRGNFLFPSAQPHPHTSFSQEIDVLRRHFGQLAASGSAYVLGDALKGFQWHVFVAGVCDGTSGRVPKCTIEVCMTGLHPESMAYFFRNEKFVDAKSTTKESGIAELLPNAEIDDYVFEPCGYSMNGLEGKGSSTIHITPEDQFSYTSVEVSGYDPADIDPSKFVDQICNVFRPTRISVALTVNSSYDAESLHWVQPFACPNKYSCAGGVMQDFACGGRMVYHQFSLLDKFAHAQLVRSLSPNTVLDTFSCSSDDEMYYAYEKPAHCLQQMKEGKFTSPVPQLAAKTTLGRENLASVLASHNTMTIPSGEPEHIEQFMCQLIKGLSLEDTFYVLDLGNVVRRFQAWQVAMPSVRPFYAVKCNPNPALLSVLASLGAGFDCASSAELDQVLALGVAPADIIFANACKMPSHVSHMAQKGVTRTTFDNEQELYKIKDRHPGADVLLRIRADDPGARCQLGNKFGAEEEEVPFLLQEARRLSLNVVGVSFHVGSGGTNPEAFVEAIAASRRVFDIAEKVGYQLSVLDIGGGFSGCGVEHEGGLWKVADAVNGALESYFPSPCGVSVIAEPGRYFAESSATLATAVYGRRSRWNNEKLQMDYWITDGLYGSFNCILYDHASVTCRQLKLATDAHVVDDRQKHFSTVFGPTCDGLDTVLRDYPLPKLNVGDWLVFPSMGAYTSAAGSEFNGFSAARAPVFYVYSETDCCVL